MRHKKRGATAGYLGSKGRKFVQKLPTQRQNTNVNKAKLEMILQDLNLSLYPILVQKNIQKSMSQLQNTLGLRTGIDSLSVSAKVSIDADTSINAQLLDIIASISKLLKNTKVSAKMISFYTFLMSK